MGRPAHSLSDKILAILRKIQFPHSYYVENATHPGLRPKHFEPPAPQLPRTHTTGDAFLLALELRGTHLDAWRHDAWVWLGHTTRRYPSLTPDRNHPRGRMKYPKALVMWKGKRINPARLLYEFYTGTHPPQGNRFHHRLRLGGQPGNTMNVDWVDVNPANYIISAPRSDPTRHNRVSAQPDDVLLSFAIERCATSGVWPNSPAELETMFPSLCEGLTPDILSATYNAIS